MELIVPREARFVRTPDGAVWIGATSTYDSWQRYLHVFDSVRVLARVRDVDVPPDGWVRSDGPGVTFAALPPYSGPVDYVRVWSRYRAVIKKEAASRAAAFILRAPGQSATALMNALPVGRPFGAEIVGDPYDVFAPGAIRHPARPLLRWRMTSDLQKLAMRASAVSYVTEQALQRRYPANPNAFTTNYSSVELPSEAFVDAPRRECRTDEPIRCVMVASMSQLYKGPDVLISAVALCRQRGLNIRLSLIGGGSQLTQMEVLARTLGVDDIVRFYGTLPSGTPVRSVLDISDLFVLPSRTEGLPRAMIEAMARALPCIGTTVGGIPELLPADNLVPPGDSIALAEKILEIGRDSVRMAHESTRNWEKAREYRSEVLTTRRNKMYTQVKEATLAWQRQVVQ